MSNFTIFISASSNLSQRIRIARFGSIICVCLFLSVGVSTRIPSDSFTFYLTVSFVSILLSLPSTIHVSFIPFCFLRFCSPTHSSHFSPTFLTIPLISVNPAFQSNIARSNFIIAFFSISAFEYFRDLLMQQAASTLSFTYYMDACFFLQWATLSSLLATPRFLFKHHLSDRQSKTFIDERPPKSASFSIFIHSNFDFQFLFFSSSFLFVLWLSGDFWNANNKLPLQPAMRLHGCMIEGKAPFLPHPLILSVRPSVLMNFLRNLRRVSISAQRSPLQSIQLLAPQSINQPNSLR